MRSQSHKFYDKLPQEGSESGAEPDIRSEDIACVAQKRVLRKSAEQKAMIREHLQKFCPLYQNMASRLEDYVDMFPMKYTEAYYALKKLEQGGRIRLEETGWVAA